MNTKEAEKEKCGTCINTRFSNDIIYCYLLKLSFTFDLNSIYLTFLY